MARILKTLGLVVSAVAAMVAVMAPAAQAETGELTAEQFPAIVTGQQVGAGPTFDIGEGPFKTVTCASQLNATLIGAADPVTFMPTYAACNSAGMPVTVTTNGCDYRFRFTQAGTTGWQEDTGEMQAGILCPPGRQIEIHIYENAMKHAENVSLCTYDVLPQPPVQAGVYHNKAGMPGDVEATVRARFTAVNTIGPAMVCGAAAFNHIPVTLTGTYTMRAFEDINGAEGAPTGLHVS